MLLNAHGSTVYNSENVEVKTKCPAAGQWMRKMWYVIYAVEYYAATKKGGRMSSAATQVNPGTITLREVRQRTAVYLITYVQNLKMNKRIHTEKRPTDITQGEREGRGSRRKAGNARYRPLCLKKVSWKDTLYLEDHAKGYTVHHREQDQYFMIP